MRPGKLSAAFGKHEDGIEGAYAAARERNKWKPEYGARRAADRCRSDQLRVDRSPPWTVHAQRIAIKAFYAEARSESLNVDHIAPLLPGRGNIVGLHVLSNLQKLTGRQDLKKGQRHEADEAAAGRAIGRA